MILLPNGCKCSELKVNPSNWESPKASVKKPWFIYYRFYDPQAKEAYPKGKLRVIKGMNEVKSLEERQTLVKALISIELNELKNLGFNPISERHEIPITGDSVIHPLTPFIQALRQAFEKAGYTNQTFLDIRSVLKYIEKAAILLRYDYIPIKDIRPSHMMLLMEQCGKLKERWTGNNYNTYLKYLSILFGQLLQYRAVEFNPVRDIKKKKTIKNHRSILSPEECREIDRFTKEYDGRLWMFIHIFFHSGSRTTEILRVQGEHVNLKKQKIKYLVLKGQQYEWVERTIKDIALPLWEQAMEGCGPKDFVFSKGLKPGASGIRAEQITRRWRTHIKKKLGIECDFYSLKHLNTDQTSAELGLNAAAAHNSHKSTAITMTYAVNEKERIHERLKKVKNSFVG
jgi:integrase